MHPTPSILNYKSIPDNSFDLLRLVFAGTVVIAHFMALSGVDELVSSAPLFDTTVAVMGFFILSGYLILASFLKQSDLRTYFEKRVRRLLPAYIAIVLISAVLLSGLSTLLFQEYFVHEDLGKYLAANLTFLNFIQPGLPGVFESNPVSNAVNGSLWTIKIEVAFYLSIPVFVYIFKRLNRPAFIFSFLILIYLFSVGYEYCIKQLVLVHNQAYSPLLHQYPAMLQYFSVGMAAYLFTNEKTFRHPFIILAGCVLFLEKFLFHTTYLWPIGLGILVFTIGFGLKNCAHSLLKGNDYSYGLYIIHFPVAQALISFGIFQWPYLLSFGSYFIIVTIGAFTSWHLLEKRFLYKKRHLPSAEKMS